MFGQIWGVLKFLKEVWDALKVLLGMVEKAKHEHAKEDIKEKTDIVADPNKSEQERLDAIKELEDRVNGRT